MLVLVPVTAATGVAWTVLRASLQPGTEPWQVIAALLGFVGLWLGGLALVSMAVAWRSAVWTVDLVRRGTGRSAQLPAPVRGTGTPTRRLSRCGPRPQRGRSDAR